MILLAVNNSRGDQGYPDLFLHLMNEGGSRQKKPLLLEKKARENGLLKKLTGLAESGGNITAGTASPSEAAASEGSDFDGFMLNKTLERHFRMF